ncbi:hypothetical protein [Anaeromyxobacter diazotrophicus]|uniref:Uncharacterized protein n=1 Tax=Anaeromyxobacter diazotrophicus TaxID=2590199 RepID=A0A7I9VPK7_9BACT|nr:hypothetical protein [Anaeromyxobacter diazotrophicus]GEJ58291.1 hypothetical protein AMYX_30320 [Anaeromyxobacter diazotrophicus]
MLYYGDRLREASPRELLAAARARLGERGPQAPRAAFLEAASLAQGLADRAFEARGEDGPDALADAALALTAALARRAWTAWEGRPAAGAPPPELEALAALPLPPTVRVKEPEGHAHYALYPETYALAARDLPRDRPWIAVGVRSIGTGLGAMAAAALGAAALVTVRPVGHPHARALRLSPELRARLADAARRGARFAVADEGPGLSGSSFLAVARALDEAGAPRERVTFLPAHLNDPGPAAAERDRARWREVDRRVVPFEEAVLPRVRAAVTALTGEAELSDLSAGAWRAHAIAPGRRLPPVFRQQERRKLLARARGGAWVARFAGLGRCAEETLALARALATAGFLPPPAGLAEGFLVQPWVEARPLEEVDLAEPVLVEHLARYLAFRAGAFPATPGEGADPAALLELLRVNAGEALGPVAAAAVDRYAAGAREAARLRPVRVDGKLERWEWLVDGGGRLVKADALDHARGHDLAGAQPIAWDVAAAEVELGLSPGAAGELRARVAPGASAGALAFLRAAYLAHRLGRWTFALATEGDPAERALVEAELGRYRGLLATALG